MDLKAANAQKAPGSREAVKAGCACDPIYNAIGLGCRRDVCGTPLYSVSSRCGLHSPQYKDAAERSGN